MRTRILLVTFLTINCAFAQTKEKKQMEKKIINPWSWQDARSYVQAVEAKNIESTLYISGQTAIDDMGVSSNANMREQLIQTIENLEKVILSANYELKNIVRLNIYTTAASELFENFDVFQTWIENNEVKQSSTVLEVKSLFETLKVEIEATVVK
jgi:enamine deaminase RidA (YjgF/YER057c/UK114 family)